MDIARMPEVFLAKMKSILKDEYEDYIRCFEEERLYGLRINTLKQTPEEFAAGSPFDLKPVPWIPNGYYYDGEKQRPARHPYYYAGLYYLQEPSAMTPAMLLAAKPGERVLDLCAAPGGKSTELGACLKGEGLLFSNDISNTRAKALLKNLELFGIPNICVSSETPEKLSGAYPEYFDKILVDAPCSGEGMFRKDPDMVNSWLEKGPEEYVPVQREILLHAAAMLKPGGRLLYSTCTFDYEENEGNIRWFLERRPEFSLVNLPKADGFSEGLDLPECVRLFPHKLQGEGHFIAMLEKNGEPERMPKDKAIKEREFPLHKYPEIQEFLSHIRREWDWHRLVLIQDSLYYLPEGFDNKRGIRFLRTGLWMGTLKKGRFEPAQPLAMTLKPEEFDQTFDLKLEDERVIRYLKGETIAADRPSKGWLLICADGFPLGFSKGNGAALKNKYYPGWRWQ